MDTVTCVAPVNIAVIKYWGKRDETLILPINDSISASLDTKQLCAKTTVMISPDFKEDIMWLNGEEVSFENPRLKHCLAEMKKRARLPAEKCNWKLHICSVNNFPTAAGLASSAAGYSALITALAKLYNVEGDISALARLGSGSACRSVFGGFVRWNMGSKDDGSDSIAKQIVPASHWPEMRILILVVNDTKKKYPSSMAMQRGVKTSEFLTHRAKYLVPKAVEKMHQAIVDKDFKTFAEITMKDSNQLHAVCLDTYPPCPYMNDVSHSIVEFVHGYNAAVNDARVAYTFDAGPNATLYLLEKDVAQFVSVLDYFFPPIENSIAEYRKGMPIEIVEPSNDLMEKINLKKQPLGQFKYILLTQVAEGPKYLNDPADHLLTKQGIPIHVQS